MELQLHLLVLFLQMNAALEIRGGASGKSATTLCVAPTATINGGGFMQLTSNMGGNYFFNIFWVIN